MIPRSDAAFLAEQSLTFEAADFRESARAAFCRGDLESMQRCDRLADERLLAIAHVRDVFGRSDR